MITSLTDAQTNAAHEYANASVSGLAVNGSVHPGTAVAATARMAGTCLFRSFAFTLADTPPGTAVLSAEADAHLPALIQTTAEALAKLRIALDHGRAGTPVPPEHAPKLGFLETQRVLEPLYRAISERRQLSGPDTAYAVAVATALLLNHCAKVLDPSVGFGIAALGYVEGLKTAPDPVRLPSQPFVTQTARPR